MTLYHWVASIVERTIPTNYLGEYAEPTSGFRRAHGKLIVGISQFALGAILKAIVENFSLNLG